MQDQLPFGDVDPDFAIGDPLDRCYTPQTLADAVVDWVAGLLPRKPGVILEPSVGGGAFVRACRRRWPGAWIMAADIDPRARGLGAADESRVGDYAEVDAGWWSRSPELVVGNPPFDHAVAHWTAGPRVWPWVWQSMILPWAYFGVGAWQLPLQETRPSHARAVKGRPWPKRVRETGVLHRRPCVVSTELVIPALEW